MQSPLRAVVFMCVDLAAIVACVAGAIGIGFAAFELIGDLFDWYSALGVLVVSVLLLFCGAGIGAASGEAQRVRDERRNDG